ncbi:MAG: DUF1566 domain-containing protein [Xanthomonadales bacterium]|nr:DUF1566 domain-containing protein [Xanthomonadales bacterium]
MELRIIKYKISVIILILPFHNLAAANNEIFVNGFEEIPIPIVRFNLNDTGIIWAGNILTGNSSTCISDIAADQDCHQGRDANAATNSNADGHAGFSFTKLDINGNQLGSTATNWSCVQDNVTGLVWEVKTNAAGIHNRINTYQWGGITAIGRDHPARNGTYFDPSWNELVTNSNDNNFCGFADWRLPTIIELSSIVNKGTTTPAIDINYFPNTSSGIYWSSSPMAEFEDFARSVSFFLGDDTINMRNSSRLVRLVRSDQ